MSATATVGGTAFARMASSTGRKCIFCMGGAALIEQRQYHPFGALGSVNVSGRRRGRPVLLIARYNESSLSALHSLLNTDKAAWEGTEITIVDQTGTSFTRCQLQDDGIKYLRRPTAGLPGGGVFCDIEANFTSWE